MYQDLTRLATLEGNANTRHLQFIHSTSGTVVDYSSEQAGYPTAVLLPEYVGEGGEEKGSGNIDLSDRDPLFEEAARLIVIQQQGSTSLIQRKFAIGYNRAGR